jgi:hypothetical protein
MLYSQRDSLLSSYVMVYIASYEGGDAMAMVKATDQRAEANQVNWMPYVREGTSASGFIRSLLEKRVQTSKGNTVVKESCLCRAELRKSENSGGSGEGGPDYRRKDSSVESGADASTTFPNRWS